MKYTVKKICEKSDIKKCENFVIDKYMWNSTQEPKTYGWLGYLENKGFFVKMVCEEQNPKRTKTEHRKRVCDDSAVEVFMSFVEEGETLTNESMYINFEINSNGALFAKYGKGRKNRQFIAEDVVSETEIQADIKEDYWTVEFVIPESFLKKICDLEAIKSGKIFYCNFYKISEDPEIEHYGAYAPIGSETPNFHLPVFFAEAIVE